MPAATGVRGCGVRTQGGVYLSVPGGAGGVPLEDFLVEPVPLDTARLGLAPIGMQLVPAEYVDGVMVRPTLVLDWVGSRDYPNVADFVEEVRHMGLSRRVREGFEFHKLSPGAKHCLVHARAWIENHELYQMDRLNLWHGYRNDPAARWRVCPINRPEARHQAHMEPGYIGPCGGLWWEDVEQVEGDRTIPPQRLPFHQREALIEASALDVPDARLARRIFERRMPSFSYLASTRPALVQPVYYPAIFAAFPILGVDVVQDSHKGSHTETAARIRHQVGGTGLPFTVQVVES